MAEQGTLSSTSISALRVPCRYAGKCKGACQHLGDTIFSPATNPGIFADMECVRDQRRRNFYVFLVVAAIVTILAFAVAYVWEERRGRTDLQVLGSEHLNGAISRLEREIGKYGVLPLTIAMDRDVSSFLENPDKAGRTDAMNEYLARLNNAAGTMQAYIIDPTGRVVASSNWKEPTSFLSRNLSYRPYFQNARADSVTGYYGIGTTANAPGYFLATAIERAGFRIGVVAIKIDLEQLEIDWLGGLDQLTMMTDSNRVIVLSSRRGWKYHSLGELAPAKLEELNRSRQYNGYVMHALQWHPLAAASDGAQFMEIGDATGVRSYLAESRFVPAVGMELMVLADYSNVKLRAAERAAIVAVLALLAVLCLRIFHQRRLAIQERLLAREVLQEAYNHLTEQFEERNRQLRTSNEDLRREVAERIQASKRLQSFQDEMIRTENLAVIGQLSAGLAHEINQPLAALSTLSENAVRFLEINDLGTVRHNLERICDLVHRMGVLTGQLRSFARRTDGETVPVNVEHSIENAVALLGHRVSKEQMEIIIEKPDGPVQAYGDAVRLEQVLVNLLSNAMDALSGNGEPRIHITMHLNGDKAIIEVSDNGHGLNNAVMERLFEPFFTTKKTSGLGLGLAISQDIVRRFGGDLTAETGQEGGALFRVILHAVIAEEKTNV